MAKQIWIDGDCYSNQSVGDVGYLVERTNHNRRSTTMRLQDRPPYTNQSYQPRLTGWCGETDNISVTGHGMARVVRVATNGRLMITRIHGAELSAALEQTGFPELDPNPA
jgi:hypothetical protein